MNLGFDNAVSALKLEGVVHSLLSSSAQRLAKHSRCRSAMAKWLMLTRCDCVEQSVPREKGELMQVKHVFKALGIESARDIRVLLAFFT